MGVISNPPYIPTEDLPGLQPEVGWHEPKLALDGGKDGLEHLLHLCEGLSSVLKPGGFFVFEVKYLLMACLRFCVVSLLLLMYICLFTAGYCTLPLQISLDKFKMFRLLETLIFYQDAFILS